MLQVSRFVVGVWLVTASAVAATAQTTPAGEETTGETAVQATAGADPRLRAEAFCDAALGGELWARTELYFGMSRADGPDVTEQEFRRFLSRVVTPRFPDGFTVFDALGQYRGRDGRIVSEPTKVLLVVHGSDARLRSAVQELRDIYRRLFQQESVLLIESPARAGF